jgi:phosphatidylserine/phosphatidylglycerophosphate/cardiolipin synthase-like enzyme
VNDFSVFGEDNGFRVKLWRGESMCLLGFDVDHPEDDFVGFAVEYKEPGSDKWLNLRNRLTFDGQAGVNGYRNFPTLQAPLQTFRWVHFPWSPHTGTYTYRVTRMHMPVDAAPVTGTSLELPIDLGPVTIADYLDVGFTRNFASSQAFEDIKDNQHITDEVKIIPTGADAGLEFAPEKQRISQIGPINIYEWLSFEAGRLLFEFLDSAVADTTIEVDAMAYDLNEPDIVSRLEQLGARLRVIIDDSSGSHAAADSAETQSAQRLTASAGENNVQRGHFTGLQHNKVFIAKRDGAPVRVLGGSTNFSYRGLYIQANNMYVVQDEQLAQLFEQMFEAAFTEMADFTSTDSAQDWHQVRTEGRPPVDVCFSPHASSDVSLQRVGTAITDATSSVLYSVAFLNQIGTGPVREALDKLMNRAVFSYGVVDKDNGLQITKPGGDVGLVDFAYLRDHAPEPFKTEWSGGSGIHIHHKFVVTDFDQPTATVFTGSSNLSPSGETNNGDHLLMIADQRIATAYAIEALRVFDHLNFRDKMQQAENKPDALLLQKPTAISGTDQPWFAKFYESGGQRERDRLTFSRR